jgi:hypothetical protein
MSVRQLLEVSVAGVPAAAAPGVDGAVLTADRVVATGAAFVAIGAVVLGVLALVRRPAGRWGTARPFAAVVIGAVAVAAGWFVLATADGGPGTGNGVVGGAAAAVLGLLGAALGGAALARARTGQSRLDSASTSTSPRSSGSAAR